MAISAAASTVGSLNSSHSTCLSSSSASSSSASKLSLLSSLHFLRPLRRIQIGNKGFSSRSLPRILPQDTWHPLIHLEVKRSYRDNGEYEG
ncbi:hypothetical protein CsSME_00035207 [Camellia sinensis var. sinensis]